MACRANCSPTGPRKARPADRLRRNPPLRSHGNVIGSEDRLSFGITPEWPNVCHQEPANDQNATGIFDTCFSPLHTAVRMGSGHVPAKRNSQRICRHQFAKLDYKLDYKLD